MDPNGWQPAPGLFFDRGTFPPTHIEVTEHSYGLERGQEDRVSTFNTSLFAATAFHSQQVQVPQRPGATVSVLPASSLPQWEHHAPGHSYTFRPTSNPAPHQGQGQGQGQQQQQGSFHSAWMAGPSTQQDMLAPTNGYAQPPNTHAQPYAQHVNIQPQPHTTFASGSAQQHPSAPPGAAQGGPQQTTPASTSNGATQKSTSSRTRSQKTVNHNTAPYGSTFIHVEGVPESGRLPKRRRTEATAGTQQQNPSSSSSTQQARAPLTTAPLPARPPVPVPAPPPMQRPLSATVPAIITPQLRHLVRVANIATPLGLTVARAASAGWVSGYQVLTGTGIKREHAFVAYTIAILFPTQQITVELELYKQWLRANCTEVVEFQGTEAQRGAFIDKTIASQDGLRGNQAAADLVHDKVHAFVFKIIKYIVEELIQREDIFGLREYDNEDCQDTLRIHLGWLATTLYHCHLYLTHRRKAGIRLNIIRSLALECPGRRDGELSPGVKISSIEGSFHICRSFSFAREDQIEEKARWGQPKATAPPQLLPPVIESGEPSQATQPLKDVIQPVRVQIPAVHIPPTFFVGRGIPPIDMRVSSYVHASLISETAPSPYLVPSTSGAAPMPSLLHSTSTFAASSSSSLIPPTSGVASSPSLLPSAPAFVSSSQPSTATHNSSHNLSDHPTTPWFDQPPAAVSAFTSSRPVTMEDFDFSAPAVPPPPHNTHDPSSSLSVNPSTIVFEPSPQPQLSLGPVDSSSFPPHRTSELPLNVMSNMSDFEFLELQGPTRAIPNLGLGDNRATVDEHGAIEHGAADEGIERGAEANFDKGLGVGGAATANVNEGVEPEEDEADGINKQGLGRGEEGTGGTNTNTGVSNSNGASSDQRGRGDDSEPEGAGQTHPEAESTQAKAGEGKGKAKAKGRKRGKAKGPASGTLEEPRDESRRYYGPRQYGDGFLRTAMRGATREEVPDEEVLGAAMNFHAEGLNKTTRRIFSGLHKDFIDPRSGRSVLKIFYDDQHHRKAGDENDIVDKVHLTSSALLSSVLQFMYDKGTTRVNPQEIQVDANAILTFETKLVTATHEMGIWRKEEPKEREIIHRRVLNMAGTILGERLEANHPVQIQDLPHSFAPGKTKHLSVPGSSWVEQNPQEAAKRAAVPQGRGQLWKYIPETRELPVDEL